MLNDPTAGICTHTPASFLRLVDASMGFCCGTESSKRGKIPAAKCVLPFLPSYLHLFPCPACFLIRSISVFVCSILCSDFALHRYASMRQDVVAMFSQNGVHNLHNSHKPASSDDWSYCAFNEQLQRIAGQLAATIEGIDVGTLV